MLNDEIATHCNQPYDCLIFVNPDHQILEGVASELQRDGLGCLNIGKELSAALRPVSVKERSSFSQKWLLESLRRFSNGPVICTNIDLLFDPNLELDPLTLFRQAARYMRMIVLWPGEISGKSLFYAIPEHHHFRSWEISNALLLQPHVLIQPITFTQGV